MIAITRGRVLACLILVLAMFGIVGAVSAAEQDEVETKITSDSMQYSATGQSVTFTGNVLVSRPDFTIKAGTITVHFEGKTGGQSSGQSTDIAAMNRQQIEKITARTKVRMEHGGRVGTCDKAEYLVTDGIFTMTGDPQLQDGKNRIQGETIRLYLKDNRSEVVGGKKQRVEALFFTPKAIQQ